MECCGMKREIDRKCLNHARVHANAQSFGRCESALSLFILVLSARAQCMTWHGVACGFACAVRMRRNN